MKKLFFRIILVGGIFLITNPLYAQTELDVERATREVDRIGREEKILEEQLRKPSKKPTEPKPEEIPVEKKEEKFFIKKINLVGCKSFPPEDFASILAKYENKELSLSELEPLARAIEREYLRLGVIAAVFIPPQEVIDGVVTLQVIEARMGELQIQEHRYFNKDRLYYYWSLHQGEILRYDKLSKSIQMMNRNPDREIKAALRAGKKPGTTDVILTPQTRFPIHFVYSLDNEGSEPTGRHSQNFGLRHSNFLGLDDILILGKTLTKSSSGIYMYHNVPISPDGAFLMYGYSRSVAYPKKEYTIFGLESKAKTYSVSLTQDLYKKDAYIGDISLKFDAKDKTTWVAERGVYNRDRLRILRLGGNYILRGFGSTTQFSPEFSQGIDAFGASNKGNPYASRKAKSTASKVNLKVQHKRMLPLNLQANLKLTGQYSSAKLTPQEEFSLGGIDSVRGYPSGDYMADNAATSSVELQMPSFFIPANWRLPFAESALKDQMTTLAFVDYGWGMRRGTKGYDEKRAKTYLSAGGGVRLSLFNQALLRLEWGFPIADNRSLTEAGHSRLHLSLDFQDRIPEEIDRISKILEEESIKQRAWQLVNEELSRPDSPIRQRLSEYLFLAQECFVQEEFKKSKEFYEKIVSLGKSLYQQAEDFVRACVNQQKELRQYQRLAIAYYTDGKFQQAKQMWQKIIDEAKIKNLAFEF